MIQSQLQSSHFYAICHEVTIPRAVLLFTTKQITLLADSLDNLCWALANSKTIRDLDSRCYGKRFYPKLASTLQTWDWFIKEKVITHSWECLHIHGNVHNIQGNIPTFTGMYCFFVKLNQRPSNEPQYATIRPQTKNLPYCNRTMYVLQYKNYTSSAQLVSRDPGRAGRQGVPLAQGLPHVHVQHRHQAQVNAQAASALHSVQVRVHVVQEPRGAVHGDALAQVGRVEHPHAGGLALPDGGHEQAAPDHQQSPPHRPITLSEPVATLTTRLQDHQRSISARELNSLCKANSTCTAIKPI